jgi:hypothetical protein
LRRLSWPEIAEGRERRCKPSATNGNHQHKQVEPGVHVEPLIRRLGDSERKGNKDQEK